MPPLSDHPSSRVVKMLVAGDSGVGKTGGLASLVDAGYKLRILDFDGGLDTLVGYVKDRSKLANVDYHTLKDEFNLVGSSLMIKKAAAFQTAMKLLNDWAPFGSVQKWDDPDHTILVVDTLSSLGRCSLNMVLHANGITAPAGQRGGPEMSHWGTAMDNVEKLLDHLTNPLMVPCHLIVQTHVTAQEQEGVGVIKQYPESLGNKLNPKIGRKFNNLISLSLSAGEKSYKTQKDSLLACKTSKPLKDKYKLETGMAEIFAGLLA